MDTFDFVNRENSEYIDRLYQQYQREWKDAAVP